MYFFHSNDCNSSLLFFFKKNLSIKIELILIVDEHCYITETFKFILEYINNFTFLLTSIQINFFRRKKKCALFLVHLL